MRAAIARVQQEFGPVRGLIHGAGVLADRKIVDQTDAQFDLVYQTKVRGPSSSLGRDRSRFARAPGPFFFVFRSLRTSRASRLRRRQRVPQQVGPAASPTSPSCRVVSFNWGPWAGGMVTDALKPIFEQEGLSLIPLGAGARLVAQEARRTGPSAVELVVVAEPARAEAQSSIAPTPASGPLAPAREELQTVFRREVDLESVPVLSAHVIDGHAVLPVALILEWMAEAAVHRNPGLLVCGVDDFRLFKGVILGHQKPASIELRAGKPARRAAQFAVPVDLCGTLANGKEVVHARTVIVLGDRHEAPAAPRRAGTVSLPALARRDLSNRAVSWPAHARHRVGRGLR